MFFLFFFVFFFQAEDGIRDLVRSRGLGDVYKRQDILSGHKGLAVQKDQIFFVMAAPRGADVIVR